MPLKVKSRNCLNYKKCGQRVQGFYATFCKPCFSTNAALKGKSSAGNKAARGKFGNAGNLHARGMIGNVGNVKTGKAKKIAGKRSGMRRSAKSALVVRKKWLDLILAKRKTWEIRGCSTAKRGWIHFAESQAGGKLKGRARLVDCVLVPRKSFQHHYNKHCVANLSMVPYTKLYAWVFQDAEKFEKPFEYEHKQGAVIWVDV